MVNIKTANIQKFSEFCRRLNHTSQSWLKVVVAKLEISFFAATTKLL